MSTQANSDTLQIENLTEKPVWVRLNSGDNLSVHPRTRSVPVPKSEIENNERVDKLVALAAIRVHPVSPVADEHSAEAKI